MAATVAALVLARPVPPWIEFSTDHTHGVCVRVVRRRRDNQITYLHLKHHAGHPVAATRRAPAAPTP